jgi:hypothetical protein
VRIDLFVFYWFTLFLQTFFFPFSVMGYYSMKGYRKLGMNEFDNDEALKADLLAKHESFLLINGMVTAAFDSAEPETNS